MAAVCDVIEISARHRGADVINLQTYASAVAMSDALSWKRGDERGNKRVRQQNEKKKKKN